MRGSVLKVRHPVLLVTLSLLVFFFCDNLIFRSGFYAHYCSPDWYAGTLYHKVEIETHRPPSGKREVLLIGNSRIQWSFSRQQFDQEHPNADIDIIDGSVPNTEQSVWYYVLKELDPTHSRYNAIVITPESYRIDSWHIDEANAWNNVEILAPILTWKEWPEFLGTLTDPDIRYRAQLLAVFTGHEYALDLQDFLLHPQDRLLHISTLRRLGTAWGYDWEGIAGSMEGLELDPVSDKVAVYPHDLDHFEYRALDGVFQKNIPEDAILNTARNAAFEKYWLGKIVEMYRGSKTRLIFIQLPRAPVPLPARAVLSSAPDLRNLLPAQPNAMFLNEHEFELLEKPIYFHDTSHLDQQGRRIFTTRFGADLLQIMNAR